MEFKNRNFVLAGAIDFENAKQLIFKNMSDTADSKDRDASKGENRFSSSIVYREQHPF